MAETLSLYISLLPNVNDLQLHINNMHQNTVEIKIVGKRLTGQTCMTKYLETVITDASNGTFFKED